ncbi:hypothetical protein B5807_03425 [Epicoccum nigrum]|uniref:Uncharacterized protein n=1 Tax=Epicoccum nigrum TaxID=105696 RepID=A0A1Y2M912_EPING|nr:hypothetical protein B5807_03425 [Epicoccum nigrum]
MKAVLPKMPLEVEIEPFIIDLSTSYSTPSSSPTDEDHESESSLEPESNSLSKHGTRDLLLETDGTNLLNFLFSPPTPSLGLFETLLADASPAARAAILYNLTLTPLVQRNITTLVSPLLHDEQVIVGVARNIAYFDAIGFIPEWELEHLLIQILACPNPAGSNTSVLDPRIICLYHLTLEQIDSFRNALVPKQKLAERAGRMNMLKLWHREYEKQLRFKANRAALALPYGSHLDPGIPLSYGCSTSAQMFTDVNEMYICEAPPCKYWAFSRATYHAVYRRNQAPIVKMPCKDTDNRVAQDSEPESMVS